MATCSSCGSFIVVGGVRSGQNRYCNHQCLQVAQQASTAARLPPDIVARRLDEVWRGRCPICKGPGPVDVYKHHKIYSLLFFTRWISGQVVACRSCGRSRQTEAQLFSILCGWWGFPWGLIMTPVQISRNMVARGLAPKPGQPSQDLRQLVMFQLANENATPGAQTLAQETPRRGRDPSAPIQEGDRVTVTVGDRATEATVLAVRDTYARCSFADGRRVWVPLASLTLVPRNASEDAPAPDESRSHAGASATDQPGALPFTATGERSPGEKSPDGHAASENSDSAETKGDVPVTSRGLVIFYAAIAVVLLLLPPPPFGILYWLPLIPYFHWRKLRPLRARKWLPHAIVVLGLGVVNFFLPLRYLLLAAFR